VLEVNRSAVLVCTRVSSRETSSVCRGELDRRTREGQESMFGEFSLWEPD
jgi:hypothetical protein